MTSLINKDDIKNEDDLKIELIVHAWTSALSKDFMALGGISLTSFLPLESYSQRIQLTY